MLLGLAAIVIWATSSACVLWIGRQVGAWQYLAIGNGIGCLGQIVLYRLQGRPPRSLFVLPARLWALALLGFVFYSICYTFGLLAATSDAQAVGVGLMNQIWPILTVLFALLFVPGNRMNRRLGLAAAISCVGLLVANRYEIRQARLDRSAMPYLLGALAAISWALYSALLARWRTHDERYVTAPAGFLLVSLMGAVGCLLTRSWQPVDTRTWLAFLYLGLVTNSAGYMLWEAALHRAPTTTLGLLAAATPILSTLCLLALFAFTGTTRSLPVHGGTLLTGALLIGTAVLLVSPRDASRQ